MRPEHVICLVALKVYKAATSPATSSCTPSWGGLRNRLKSTAGKIFLIVHGSQIVNANHILRDCCCLRATMFSGGLSSRPHVASVPRRVRAQRGPRIRELARSALLLRSLRHAPNLLRRDATRRPPLLGCRAVAALLPSRSQLRLPCPFFCAIH